MAEAQRHLDVIRDLARAGQGTREPSEVLRRICAIVSQAFAFDRVTLSRYDEEKAEITALAACGLDDAAIPTFPRWIEDCPLHKQALEEGRPAFVGDVEGEAVSGEHAEELGVTFVLPLFSAGRCLGFLDADGAGNAFDLYGEVVGELETVAVLGATLLENALAHEETRRANEIKDQFISLASHELRTPACVIHGITSTLHLRGSELNEEQLVELRAALHAQSARLRQLVEQLLDLSRLEASAIRVNPVRLPVRNRIEELVLLLAERRANEVQVDIAPELEAVVDPVALDRIASNVIGNALRYGAPPITIRAGQYDRHFRLAVEDRGSGIHPELAPRLFERFSRGASKAEGTGLGLAIARSYARAHGGELFYQPAHPHGARFELVLPRDEVAQR